MRLLLQRTIQGPRATVGEMKVNGEHECFTLEDVSHSGAKVYGETAIPAGTYDVTIDFSHHFNRLMPHILNVPNFEGIRIHSGNTDKDTEGCILVGRKVAGSDLITQSHDAFAALYAKLSAAHEAQEMITISILDVPQVYDTELIA